MTITPQLLEKIETATNLKEKIEAYDKIASLFLGTNNYDSLEWYKKSYYEAMQANDDEILVNTLINLASIYDDLNILEKSKDFYFKAEKIAIKNNFKIKLGKLYNGLGIVFRKDDDYLASIDHYYKSLQIRKEIGNKNDIIMSLNNLGVVYRYIKEYKKAFNSINNALLIAYEIDSYKTIIASLINLGLLYNEQYDYTKALTYLKKALKKIKKDDKRNAAAIYNNIGISYNGLDEVEKAKKAYKLSIKFYKEIGDSFGVVRILYSLSDLNSEKISQKEVIKNLLEGLELSLKIGYKKMIVEFYHKLSSQYGKANDYENAYKNLLKANEVNKKIFSENLSKQIAELQTKYNFEQKEKDKELYRLKYIELTRINSLLKTYSQKLENSEHKLKKSNATKDKFFSIIAHDLRNPFNTLFGTINLLQKHFDKVSKEKLHKYLDKLSTTSKYVIDLLENLLEWSQTQSGNIKFEPDYNDLSIILSQNIKGLGLTAKAKGIVLENKTIEKTIAYFDNNMITVVFRNLLSNAIKFCSKDDIIKVYTKSDNEFITIYVSDTGPGMDEETMSKLFILGENKSTKGSNNEKGTGLGLLLCKEFVEKNNGELKVKSTKGFGTIFSFTLQLKK